MRSVVLYTPHLDRDLSRLAAAVPDLHIQVGERTERGEDGCLESHKEAVRTAIELNEPKLFVMEDDCEFTRHFDYERWLRDAEWAQANGYDVMVGGCTRTYDEKLVRDGMVGVSGFHSAHCIMYFESSYAKVLNAVQPYDLSICRDCGCKAVMTIPFVAVQRPSYSGILRVNVDYVPYYELNERSLVQKLGI